MPEQYDVQQICENGHQITDCYKIRPEKQKKFCDKCGAPTINSCPHCHKEIQGAEIRIKEDYPAFRTGRSEMVPWAHVNVPLYCDNCGKPFLWTENKIQTAIQTLMEFGNLSDDEKKTIEQDINNIARDVPQSELSANRIKRILKNCGMVGSEIIMEFASRTAAKVLKNP
jgi:hypothetical protein